jgi:hypothetical protein
VLLLLLASLLLLLQATAHEDLKRLLGKAQAIDELESTIPAFIERLMPRNYPAFVHVLRVGLEVRGETLVLAGDSRLHLIRT